MKSIKGSIVVGVIFLFAAVSNSWGYSYSGDYMFTNGGNDSNADSAALIEQINVWFAGAGISFFIDELEEYGKVDAPDTASGGIVVSYEDDNMSGSWQTEIPVQFYTVKGSNEYALYWLGIGGMSSGTWSTMHITAGKNDNQPELSHLSAYNGQLNEVPEPGSLLLFSLGLAGLAGVCRKSVKEDQIA